MSETPLKTDLILPFQLEEANLRGRLVRVSATYDETIRNHGYPEPVCRLLGQCVALAAVLAGALKYDGLFTLQIQSDGPINLMVVDISSNGDLRATTRFDAEKVAEAEKQEGGEVPRLLGNGQLVFTVDQGADMDRYQGMVALVGETLSDCAREYFTRSEQIETAIELVALPTAEAGPTAAALMIQRMPGEVTRHQATDSLDEAEESWNRAVVLLQSATAEELTDVSLAPQDLLYRLYHQDGVKAYPAKPLTFKCRCSRAKVKATLASFPRAEVADLKEDGRVTVTCQFCGLDYLFEEAEVDALHSNDSAA